MSLAPPKVLHCYRCRNCFVVMFTAVKVPGGYVSCNGCRSYMKFLFSEPVETPEQQAVADDVARLGKVYRFAPTMSGGAA